MSNVKKGAQPPVDNPILLWPKPKLWTVRILLWILIIGWFALGYYLHDQAAKSRAKVERNRIEAQRQEEILRRAAQYRQSLQDRNQASSVRNVFDGR